MPCCAQQVALEIVAGTMGRYRGQIRGEDVKAQEVKLKADRRCLEARRRL